MNTDTRARWSSEAGFSLAEMLIAVGIMVAVTATMFALINPAQGTFKTQPEVSEMQQRLRVGVDVLQKDLLMAGGGAYQGSMSGSLAYMFASVLPYREGSTNDDPPGTYRTDTITMMYVPTTVAQTSLSTKGPDQGSAEIGVNPEPGCPAGDPLCGFQQGMTVMIYDDSGNYDTFDITNVQPPAMHLQHNTTNFTYTNYQPNVTKIVQFKHATYYLKTDNANKVYQLMFYDGGLGPDQPVVDNVVALQFDYYGDPNPPTLIKPLTSNPPVTSYGPKPPSLAEQPTTYPAGENCVFQVVAGQQVPRLPVLNGGGQALVHLNDPGIAGSSLTDGPWCPDAANPNRWDADLLRIRKIAVRLRVQAALDALRGPAGLLFTHGGTSTGAYSYAPDQELRFEVTPRNLNLGR